MKLQRNSWVTLLSIVIVLSTGCSWIKQFRQTEPAIPMAFSNAPSLEQLTSSINKNTNNVRQIQSAVKVSMDGVPAKLTGNLAIERPNNIRIQAGVLGVPDLGVDIGSNDSVFWVWSKASVGGMEPVMLYSTHEAFSQSRAAKTIPIQPQWISQALGLVTFDSRDEHTGPFQRNDGRVEIRSRIKSPQGDVTRVVVVDPKYGTINRVTMYDSSNTRLAYADAYRYSYDAEHQVRLPRHVEIYFNDPNTGKQNKLSIALDSVTLNAFYGDRETIWAMPQPADVRKIDISRVNLQPSSNVPSGNNQQSQSSTTRPRVSGLGSRLGGPPRGFEYR